MSHKDIKHYLHRKYQGQDISKRYIAMLRIVKMVQKT
jgi:hypothetical protein